MKRTDADDDKTRIKSPSKSLQKVPERFHASVVILEGYAEGMEYPIEKAYAVIGRDKDADVSVKDPLVSRSHAAILWDEGRFVLKDLNSTNGTHLKGKPVKETDLRHGDKFRVGDTVLQFILEDAGVGKVYKIRE